MFKNIKELGVITLLLTGGLSTQVQASDSDSDSGDWNLSLSLQTNHLWHGLTITDTPMTAVSLQYITADNKTTFGLWGGASFDGEYQEFTYSVSHKFTDNFFVELVSHGNHSGIDDVDIWDYSSDPLKTGNFVDIGMGYTFEGEMPITVYYSVILVGIDTITDQVTDEEDRSWTNYIEVSAPVWHGKEGKKVKAFIGGAFSPVHDENFYSDNADITNVGFTFSQEINILGTTFPISATAMWNPALNNGSLQAIVNFF
ncbi:MAG: hypothetical protein V5788_03025 [Shewanella sp.]